MQTSPDRTTINNCAITYGCKRINVTLDDIFILKLVGMSLCAGQHFLPPPPSDVAPPEPEGRAVPEPQLESTMVMTGCLTESRA